MMRRGSPLLLSACLLAAGLFASTPVVEAWSHTFTFRGDVICAGTKVPNREGLVSVRCSSSLPNWPVAHRNCSKDPTKHCYSATIPHCPRNVCPFELTCVATVDAALLPPCCRRGTKGEMSGDVSGTFNNNTFTLRDVVYDLVDVEANDRQLTFNYKECSTAPEEFQAPSPPPIAPPPCTMCTEVCVDTTAAGSGGGGAPAPSEETCFKLAEYMQGVDGGDYTCMEASSPDCVKICGTAGPEIDATCRFQQLESSAILMYEAIGYEGFSCSMSTCTSTDCSCSEVCFEGLECPSPSPTPSPQPSPRPSPRLSPERSPDRPSCTPSDMACMGHPLCSKCVLEDSRLYRTAGVQQVCQGCLCVDAAIQPACYKCLTWNRPRNSKGDFCFNCASLYTNPDLGGPAAAKECFDCTVNLDGVCTKPLSCADPPTVTVRGTPYTADVAEIMKCWGCMAQHRWYKWGTGACGDSVPLSMSTTPKTNPPPP